MQGRTTPSPAAAHSSQVLPQTPALSACCAALAAVCCCVQLEVRDLNSGGSSSGEVCFKGRVGSTVNNALHVAQHTTGQCSRADPSSGSRAAAAALKG